MSKPNPAIFKYILTKLDLNQEFQVGLTFENQECNSPHIKSLKGKKYDYNTQRKKEFDKNQYPVIITVTPNRSELS